MCFGPSSAEKAAAAESQKTQQEAAAKQQEAADAAQREEAERRAEAKQGDIESAISSRTARRGMSGGAGRRSLLTSSGAGFLGRFQ
jgi:hypothetical protein